MTHGPSGPQRGSPLDASRVAKSSLKTSGLRFSNWFLNLAWSASHQAPLKHMLPNRLLFQQQTSVCLAKDQQRKRPSMCDNGLFLGTSCSCSDRGGVEKRPFPSAMRELHTLGGVRVGQRGQRQPEELKNIPQGLPNFS